MTTQAVVRAVIQVVGGDVSPARERITPPAASVPLCGFCRTADGLVAVVGELDALTGPCLERYLAGEPGPKRLDLRAVTFLDTSGLDSLERAERRCQEHGWTFTIEQRSPAVERLLQLVGLAEEAVVPPAAVDDGARSVDESSGDAPPSRPNLLLITSEMRPS
jgi:stage II sporulation protein AA (anti-sigma F factor antagonist)